MIGPAAMERRQRELNASPERPATGKRINRASDDPSGVVVGGPMSAEPIESISKDIDGYTLEEKRLGAIDGAQGALSDLLLELNGLALRGLLPDRGR